MDILRLTLRQLQIFAAVARCGSTTAASADVALSQSATSSAVNELERLLSLRLFDRAGKRLLLNDNGRALLPRALALLDGAADIEHMARDSHAQRQSLRIGASTTLGNYLLPGLLSRFLAASPPQGSTAWRSKVSIGNTEAICDAVAAFELDVGLIEGHCTQAALAVTPWRQDALLIVASPDHVLTRLAHDAGRAGAFRSRRCAKRCGCCARPARAPAKPPTSGCCRSWAPTSAALSWAAPRPSSTPPRKVWAWPACRNRWSATCWPADA